MLEQRTQSHSDIGSERSRQELCNHQLPPPSQVHQQHKSVTCNKTEGTCNVDSDTTGPSPELWAVTFQTVKLLDTKHKAESSYLFKAYDIFLFKTTKLTKKYIVETDSVRAQKLNCSPSCTVQIETWHSARSARITGLNKICSHNTDNSK